MIPRRRRAAALLAALTLALSGLAVVLAPAASAAPPSNDNLASAAPLTLGTTVTADTTEATLEPGEPSSCTSAFTSNFDHTVWFTWTATKSQPVSLQTLGTAGQGDQRDTVVAVYTGSSYPLADVACDDQGSSGNLSLATFDAVNGTTYRIQVGIYDQTTGPDDGPGPVDVRLTAPTNDDLANAAAVVGRTSTVVVDNTTATKEPGEVGQTSGPDCSTLVSSVWFKVTPQVSGDLVVATSSTGTNRDTVLNVWTGPATRPTFPLTPVACNDDVSDSNFFSGVTAPVTGGQTYYVQVASWSAVTVGGFAVSFTVPFPPPPANDDLAGAQPLSLGNAFQATTKDATLQDGEVGQSTPGVCSRIRTSVWFVYTATSNTPLVVETSGGADGYDSVVNVWSGPASGAAFPLTPVACDDDNGAAKHARLGFEGEAGTTYYIQVANKPNPVQGDPGPGQVDVLLRAEPGAPVAPANDNLAMAEPLTTGVTVATTTAASTLQLAAGETGQTSPTVCNDIRNSVWFLWTAPSAGRATVETSSAVVGTDTVLNVWRSDSGTPSFPLTAVACDDDSGVDALSKAQFFPTTGTTYWIQVSNYYAETELKPAPGPLQLQVTQAEVVPPPANDDLANAAPLSVGAPVSVDNSVATTQQDETTAGSPCTKINATAWYAVTPSTTRGLTVDTLLTDGIDTVLGVWEGPPAASTLASLDPVACNDDAAGQGNRSSVTWLARKGTTYYVQVGSYTALGTGLVTVSLSDYPSTPTVTTLDSAVSGRSVELRAAVVTDPGGDPAVGSVELFDGTISLGSVDLVDGEATKPLTDVAPGMHDYTAVYTPSTVETAGSTSAVESATVVVTTTLSLSAAVSGQRVTLDATQAAADAAPAPQGTIEFFEGTTSRGVVPTDPAGHARLVLTNVAAGPHTYTASFTPAPASGYQSAVSPAASVSVAATPPAKARSTTSVKAPKQVKKGTRPFIAITVKRGAKPASGTVVVRIGGKVVASVSLAGNGTAAVKLPKVTKKTTLTVGYTGNATTLPSSAKTTIKVKKPKK